MTQHPSSSPTLLTHQQKQLDQLQSQVATLSNQLATTQAERDKAQAIGKELRQDYHDWRDEATKFYNLAQLAEHKIRKQFADGIHPNEILVTVHGILDRHLNINLSPLMASALETNQTTKPLPVPPNASKSRT